MIRVSSISLSPDENISQLRRLLEKKLKTKNFRYRIERESLDARKRGGRREIRFQYRLLVETDNPRDEAKLLQLEGVEPVVLPVLDIRPGLAHLRSGDVPIVVGFGPAGIFAAYLLAKMGYRPIVVERGKSVEERQPAIQTFWQGGPLDTENNVQFGEGGAGTFSDGKLTSRSKDPWVSLVKEIFVENGAPEEILYLQAAHIGTDLLREVIRTMRERILQWGGQVHFSCKMQNLLLDSAGSVQGIETNQGSFYGPVFLGIGHSARDTFRQLVGQHVEATAKAFAVGFRIEHPQALINQIQFGEYANHPRMGAASYQVHSTLDSNRRNAYSFCMCPGGLVIAAASQAGCQVVNGMSYHARDGEFANSAMLCSVKPGLDFPDGVLSGVEYQDAIERTAFGLTQTPYFAPAQKVEQFIAQALDLPYRGNPEISRTSYQPGVENVSLTGIYSPEITGALARGIAEIGSYMPGFIGQDAVLLGVETRSSSPLRFTRDEASRESVSHPGLYPIGEGAGYAGGIISAALDGLHSAHVFIERFAAKYSD